ncbi:MAG: hypothetical protein IPP79_13440 [Chitinophagaceae bacterium]|nr:hypothetical protein [Chitinophagaceae bacterium]
MSNIVVQFLQWAEKYSLDFYLAAQELPGRKLSSVSAFPVPESATALIQEIKDSHNKPNKHQP